ncbi:MAG: DUF6538 domain-containing protein [Gluconobacter japonicus]|uniref:DUF6538 domain-containing protein n=1 Tax=Gluconobacter japonicus TaxID=376620 RepID=UPI0039E96B11
MLIRLQAGFHFRRGIPVRFRPALGKREIWHSLETFDRNLARTRACAMYGLTSSAFRVHQSGHVFIGRNILAQQGA